MKILVTGGTGFVGPRIVHALRTEQRDVRALVRRPEHGAQLASLGVELATGDVTDPASLTAALDGCTHVVHLVAIIKGQPHDFERVMTQGTRNVLAAAKNAGVERFVLMSALGTTMTTKDVVPYFGAKWAMEQETIASGLEYTIFRPSFVFGRGGALQTFMKQVRYSPVVTVIGSGHAADPADLDRRRRRALRARARHACGREQDVRDRRPGHRHVGRAVPDDREGARQAARPGAHPGGLARTGARLTQWIPGRAAHDRPGRDDRSRRQRRHEHRCRPHVPAPARPARRADPARRLSLRLSLLLLLVAANQRMVQLVERELAADGVEASDYGALSLIGVRDEMRLTDSQASSACR